MKKNTQKIDYQLYEEFHKKSTKQKRVISENDYTYFNILNVIHSHLQEKKLKILDFGCGVGTTSTYFAQLGHTVIGVDVSSKSIDVAISNAKLANLSKNCQFKVLNKNYSVSKDANKYDLICLFEVIEHVPNDYDLLNSLLKMLKKNGMLMVTTRSKNSLVYRLGLVNSFEKRVGHVRRYTDQSIQQLFSNLDLQVISFEKVDSLIRDCLYCFKPLGIFVKLIRGPVVPLAIAAEKPLISLLGNSGYIVIAKKKK